MKSFINKRLLASGLGLFVLLFAANETSAQGVLGDILARMDTSNKNLQSLKSDVTMVKYDSVLKISDTYRGETSYLPKTKDRIRYMRLDWKKPNEQISLQGDEYELYKPSINMLYFGKVDKAKNSASAGGILGFLTMSRAQLKANYAVRYLGEESLNDGEKTLTWRLELTPKKRASYKIAEIWIDKDGMPRQFKVIERNDDTTTLLLTDIQPNVTIKTDVFTLNYPRSVTRRQV
jgi:outer membrane lipoprotein-sorting protein